MGTRVDPFVIPIPKGLLQNKETRIYFEYLNRFLHDLWIRTGGGTDSVDDSIISEIFGAPIVPLKALDIIELASGGTALTSVGDQFIVCNNTALATITLNATPEDGEDVVVSRRDGAITVNGTINGDTSMSIAIRYSTMHFKYSIAANEWAII